MIRCHASGSASLGQLHRAHHVGEQHRHLLALALQGAARRTDLLGQVLRGNVERGIAARPLRRPPGRHPRRRGQRPTAGVTERLARRIRGAAARTHRQAGKRPRASPAKACPGGIGMAARWAVHVMTGTSADRGEPTPATRRQIGARRSLTRDPTRIGIRPGLALKTPRAPSERGSRCIGETGFEPATARPPAGGQQRHIRPMRPLCPSRPRRGTSADNADASVGTTVVPRQSTRSPPRAPIAESRYRTQVAPP